MIQAITRAFVLLSALGSLILPSPAVLAQDVNLSISTQINGLSLEFPVSTINGNYTPDDPVLATVKFGGNKPLLITEKKGLEPDTPEEQIVSLTKSATPSPIISPYDPLIDSTPAATVVFQEQTTKFILDSFPTPIATATLTPTRRPTSIPTPTAIPAVTQTQTATTIQLSNGGLNADKLFDMSNAHRASKGLPPFQKDERACRLAAERAPEIAAEVANGNMHAGMYGRNLPYWNTENIISMGSEEGAFNWWINDDIHRQAIEGNYTYSCVACHGNNCAQEFTNFQPK